MVFVNKGSKYWQENWENHVDLLEDNVIGPLYKTIITRPDKNKDYKCDGFKDVIIGPAPYSVSKINQIVSLYVVILWCILMFYAIFDKFSLNPLIVIIILVFTIIAAYGICICGKTDNNNQEDLKATLRKTTIKKYKN